jgi:tungstate transport system substrate-binding protein
VCRTGRLPPGLAIILPPHHIPPGQNADLMTRRTAGRTGVLLLLGLAAACGRAASPAIMVVASTTSLYDSGLLDELVPAFEAAHPLYRVRVIAVGSGHALELGRRGDADVLLVHSPADEERFMAAGHGARRLPVMRNDFVLVGPAHDPARVAAAAGVLDALRRIADVRAPLISRGDSSGTHRRELALWNAAAGEPPQWRTEVGQGMGETLGIASERQAYTLTDRATFLALGAALQLVILIEDAALLDNPYSVITVSGARNAEGADRFAEWLASAAAAETIRAFGRDHFGEAAFVPQVEASAPH